MKQTAKVRALARISAATGVQLPEHAMLDVQVRGPACRTLFVRHLMPAPMSKSRSPVQLVSPLYKSIVCDACLC